MKKLWIGMLLVLPVWLAAQDIKNGTISFDFGKKKKQASDSIGKVQLAEPEDTIVGRPAKGKKHIDSLQRVTNKSKNANDYKKDGIFSGLFHAGVNAAQIDGDIEYGYKYFGAELGLGALARVHKILSLSLELNYAMKGARARLNPSATNLEKYTVQLDYLEAAIALNAHYKQLLMFTIGVSPGFLTRYKELDYDGVNVTNRTNPLGEPRKFGMCGFAALHVIIKQHYAVGARFAYSMLKVRSALPGTGVNGEYNNYISLRFMYILQQVKKAK